VASNRRNAGSKIASHIARSGREVAFVVLHRVCDDGAYAMRALDAELSRARVDPRDAALATETVYGALRVLPALDAALSPYLRKPLSGMDGLTRAVLRASAYQLLHLSRVPPYAIVDEAVSYVRRARSRASGGFVNAVLRRVAEARPEQPSPPSHIEIPAWLRGALTESLGPERTAALVDERARVPALGLRVHGVSRDVVRGALSEAATAAEIEDGPLSEQTLLLRRAGDPRRLPGFQEGHFAVQEEGAQLVALCAGVEAGQAVADLCAGHGGKTLAMAAQLGGRGRLAAVDLDERKLEGLLAEAQRLGATEPPIETLPLDLSVGVGDLRGEFDRVLLDAPCTGVGTLHRRPELLLRLSKDDPARMATLQTAILRRACELLRPGGELVYAVCSPLAQEGPGVVEAVLRELPDFSRADPAGWVPGLQADADGVLRIGPWSSPGGASCPDAYQVIRLIRDVDEPS